MQTALEAAGLPRTLMPISQAAEVCHCTEDTIRRWVRDGIITAWSMPWGAGKYLVDITQILQPVVPTGKPSGLRYSATAETRAKMKASAQARWAALKALEAQAASLDAPVSDSPTNPPDAS